MPPVQLYYALASVISLLLTMCYAFFWRKHFDTHMTVVFVLIPVANLAYRLLYLSGETTAVMVGLKVVYISGCFLPWFITMCIASLCRIEIPRWARIAMLLVSAVLFASVLTIGYLPLYYKSLTLERVGDSWVLHKEYGPMHTVYDLCVILYFIAELAVIIHAYRKKRQVSRRVLLNLFLPIPFTILAFFVNRFTLPTGVELIPVAYLVDQVAYLFVARRMVLYDVSDVAVESLAEQGETGFVSFDFKLRFLGCNETAARIFPALKELMVDQPIAANPAMQDCLRWLEAFRADETRDTFHHQDGDRVFLLRVTWLFEGHRRRGYQFFITDDTKNQQYIALLNTFNEQLRQEVDEKTAHIREMHDRLVLGMAAMVESRDHSTGGHIRRTSENVRILTDAMRRIGAPGLTDEFCRRVIQAAPMHDLGKIAVDDAILRKPGRYTPEEYAAMKIHPVEGARVVSEILQGTDDPAFRDIAVNVAHYHHERWDGTGYPDGLRGEEIPLESRIMAIADVYDALVSRRVYKEQMSFDRADAIIEEGMGTQFDPALRPCYEAARPALEAYYSSLEDRNQPG